MKNFNKIFLTLSLGYLAFAVFLAASSDPAVSNAIANATTIKQESFTELYFEDHLQLPTKVTANTAYSFKFTIHNLENEDMSYPYEVYADLGNGDRLLIDKRTVALHANESKTIKEIFKVTDPFTRLKIVTNLTDKNQQISFWIEGTNLAK